MRNFCMFSIDQSWIEIQNTIRAFLPRSPTRLGLWPRDLGLPNEWSLGQLVATVTFLLLLDQSKLIFKALTTTSGVPPSHILIINAQNWLFANRLSLRIKAKESISMDFQACRPWKSWVTCHIKRVCHCLEGEKTVEAAGLRGSGRWCETKNLVCLA